MNLASLRKPAFVFSALVIVSAALFFWLLGLIIWSRASGLVLPAALTLGAFAALWLFFDLARPDQKTHWAVLLCVLLAAWFFAFRLRIDIGLIVLLPACVLLWYSRVLVERLDARSLRFSLYRSARVSMPFFFSAIGLILIMALYISPLTGEVLAAPIPRAWYDRAVVPASVLFKEFLDFSLDDPLDKALLTLLGSGAAVTAENLDLPPGVDLDDPRIQEEMARMQERQAKEIEETRQRYAEQFGVAVTEETTVGEFGYLVISKELDKFRLAALELVLIAYVVVVYLMWHGVSVPLLWISVFIAEGIFVALKAAGFARIEKVPAEKDALVFGSKP